MSEEISIVNHIKDRVDEFIKEIDGLYREHISDTLLGSILRYNIYKAWTQDKREFNTNLVYSATVFLFEGQLEYACGVHKNGHHTAQFLCKIFDKTPIKKEENEAILY